MPANRVKIFGERNTGTNALKRIVEQNSSAICLPGTSGELNPFLGRIGNSRRLPAPGLRERLIDWVFAGRGPLCSWKHCATNFADASAFDGVLVLFTVRHPASWLVSLFNRPYHRPGPQPATLAQFVGSPWRTVGRERLGRSTFRPLELLQLKLDWYRALAAELSRLEIAHRFVRFEDLVLRQAETFADLAPAIAAPAAEFVALQASTKDRSKTLDDYREHYGKERWREELRGLEETIDAQVDWAKFEPFGYQPLLAERD